MHAQVFGVKNSLNVACCASIVLYEVLTRALRKPNPNPNPKALTLTLTLKGAAPLGEVRGRGAG